MRRTELAKRIPWVTHLAWAEPCDGFTWGKVPLKALYVWGPRDNPKPPIGMEAYRCKLPAYWEFEALPEDDWDTDAATSGIYCWQHLLSQLYNYRQEYARLEDWYSKLRLIE